MSASKRPNVARETEGADYQQRIRLSFAKQGLMSTLGATLGNISPGFVEVTIRADPAITQHSRGGSKRHCGYRRRVCRAEPDATW